MLCRDTFFVACFFWFITLLRTNISHPKALLTTFFLFEWWGYVSFLEGREKCVFFLISHTFLLSNPRIATSFMLESTMCFDQPRGWLGVDCFKKDWAFEPSGNSTVSPVKIRQSQNRIGSSSNHPFFSRAMLNFGGVHPRKRSHDWLEKTTMFTW